MSQPPPAHDPQADQQQQPAQFAAISDSSSPRAELEAPTSTSPASPNGAGGPSAESSGFSPGPQHPQYQQLQQQQQQHQQMLQQLLSQNGCGSPSTAFLPFPAAGGQMPPAFPMAISNGTNFNMAAASFASILRNFPAASLEMLVSQMAAAEGRLAETTAGTAVSVQRDSC
jgi:hypothetical protein